MIDWNNNGQIDPVDIGISIAASQEDEPEEDMVAQKETFFEQLKRWFESKRG